MKKVFPNGIKLLTGKSLIIGASLFLAAGCTSSKIVVPTTALTTAKEALLNAQQSDIVRVAPLEIRIAQERLESAHEAYRNNDYAAADRLAQESLLSVQLAEAKTKKDKTIASKNDLQDTVTVLKKEISRE